MAATATARTALPVLNDSAATQITYWTVVLTSTYTSGGDTLDLSAYPTQSGSVPVSWQFQEAPTASVAPSGYNFYYQPGTTPADGKIRVTSAAGTEISAAGYPAACLAALIVLRVEFPRGF